MAPTSSAVAPRAAIVPPRRACILHWHASPRGCTDAARRPRRVQGPFPPQYSMLPSVIVQAARSIVAAAAPAIQAAAGVTVPAPTTTISAPSSAPSFVTAAERRTNRECRELVEPPPPSDRRFARHRPASSASEISWPARWARGLPDRAWRGRCMVRRCLDWLLSCVSSEYWLLQHVHAGLQCDIVIPGSFHIEDPFPCQAHTRHPR